MDSSDESDSWDQPKNSKKLKIMALDSFDDSDSSEENHTACADNESTGSSSVNSVEESLRESSSTSSEEQESEEIAGPSNENNDEKMTDTEEENDQNNQRYNDFNSIGYEHLLGGCLTPTPVPGSMPEYGSGFIDMEAVEANDVELDGPNLDNLGPLGKDLGKAEIEEVIQNSDAYQTMDGEIVNLKKENHEKEEQIDELKDRMSDMANDLEDTKEKIAQLTCNAESASNPRKTKNKDGSEVTKFKFNEWKIICAKFFGLISKDQPRELRENQDSEVLIAVYNDYKTHVSPSKGIRPHNIKKLGDSIKHQIIRLNGYYKYLDEKDAGKNPEAEKAPTFYTLRPAIGSKRKTTDVEVNSSQIEDERIQSTDAGETAKKKKNTGTNEEITNEEIIDLTKGGTGKKKIFVQYFIDDDQEKANKITKYLDEIKNGKDPSIYTCQWFDTEKCSVTFGKVAVLEDLNKISKHSKSKDYKKRIDNSNNCAIKNTNFCELSHLKNKPDADVIFMVIYSEKTLKTNPSELFSQLKNDFSGGKDGINLLKVLYTSTWRKINNEFGLPLKFCLFEYQDDDDHVDDDDNDDDVDNDLWCQSWWENGVYMDGEECKERIDCFKKEKNLVVDVLVDLMENASSD